MIKIYFKANIFILGFLFLTLAKGQDPDFSAVINAKGAQGIDTVNTALSFGFSPSATDGYDEGVDFYAPPAPPPPSFDAALGWVGDRYYTQIVNGSVDDLVEHEWEVQLQYPSDNTINLTWDNTGWTDMMTSALLQDAFGCIMFNVDMLTETGLVLTNPAFNLLKLKITPKEFVLSNELPIADAGADTTGRSSTRIYFGWIRFI